MKNRSLLLSSLLVLSLGHTACSKEKLAAVVCEPGAFRCTESGAQTCNLKGTGWAESPCPEGEVCVTGQCSEEDGVPECRPVVCEPNETVCGADHLYVYTCDETGTEMHYSHSCVNPPMDGVCYSGECVAVCAEGQKSYLGCEYFAVDLDNADVFCGYDDFGQIVYCDAANSQYAVVLSNPNPEESAYVMITKGDLNAPVAPEDICAQPDLPDNYVAASVIPPRGIEIFELPSRNVNGTVKEKLAYRVVSNIPVTAYQFNPLENVDVFSNDASVLLPTTTASDDFLVMTREQTFDDLKGFLTVVGIEELPTQVTVTVTSRTLPGPGIPALSAGESYTTTLSRYDVLNIETNFIGGDLTGSRVVSSCPPADLMADPDCSRKVIVFAGSEAANTPNTSRCDLTTNTCEQDSEIECGCTEADGPNCSPHAPCASYRLITCCADHLEQQMFPISTWGTEYIAVRSFPRSSSPDPLLREKDTWRFLAAEDGTVIDLTPAIAEIPVLQTGQWYEIETNQDFVVTANHPILVGQFLAAEQAPNPGRDEYDAGIGDPAFILAVPKRQFRDSYVFLAPDKYEKDYVSIAMKAGTSARMDGTAIEEIPGALLSPIDTGEWLAARIPIGDGFHTLSCTATCSVMVHGYDSYVSYGYPGGLNLEDL